MKKIILLLFLLSKVMFSENEINLNETILFQNRESDYKVIDLMYVNDFVSYDMKKLNYDSLESGNLELDLSRVEISECGFKFEMFDMSFNSNRIELFSLDVEIESQRFKFYKGEFGNKIGETEFKFSILHGKDNLFLKSNKANGTFENIQTKRVSLNLKRLNKKLHYSSGEITSDAIINEVSYVGSFDMSYKILELGWGNYSVYYSRLNLIANYDFDFSTVGLLALTSQDYFQMDSSVDLFGIEYKKKVGYKKIEFSTTNILGSLSDKGTKIYFKKVKTPIFSKKTEREKSYYIDRDNPIYFLSVIDLRYMVKKDFVIGLKKVIPFIRGVSLERVGESGEGSAGDGGSSSKESMETKDYLLSGLKIYIETKF